MKNEVEQFLLEQQLIPCNGFVVGLSGGADSVCLLLLMSEISSEYGIPLHAVHVHHGIRGESADEDARFCERLCERLSVPFHLYRIDIPKEAKEQGIGEEEAGRAARYRFFLETAEQVGAAAVAVAHHRDDNAETVLFRMCRGTGLRGLCGIPKVSRPYPNSDIRLIRPLLSYGRDEIRAELETRGEEYRTDETNNGNDYTRNYIRNQIMPALSVVNANASGHFSALAEQAQQIMELVSSETERAYSLSVNGNTVCRKELMAFTEIIRREVLLRFAKKMAGAEKDFTKEHAEAMERLLAGPVSKQLCLPYHLLAESTYDGIVIVSGGKDSQDDADSLKREVSDEMKDLAEGRNSEILLTDGEYPLGDGRILTVRVRDMIPGEPVSKKKWNKWFDCDMIKSVPVLRTRQEGDFFVIGKDGGRKLLREYFVSEKVPRAQRDSVRIVASGSEVLWIPGMRGTENYLVSERTKRVLILELREE